MPRALLRAAVCVALALSLSSCGLVKQARIQAELAREQAAIQADPFTHYFVAMQLPLEMRSRIEMASGDIAIEQGSNDIANDSRALMQNSYVLIGQTSFNASEQCWDIQKVKSLGVKIQADKALFYQIYTDTETSQHSYLEPTKQTTQTYIKGLGYVDSTSTQNNVMTSSESIRKFDFIVTYWAKYRPVLGVLTEDLTSDQARALGSNKGVFVNLINKRSPAFDADILPGDIITKINGQAVACKEDVPRIVNALAGQPAKVELVRNGLKITKTVQLNN